MGLLIKGDFDTSFGKLQQIYTRIESFHFNKMTGMCTFSYTYWPDKQSSDFHTPVQEGDKSSKAINMVDTEIIVYKDSTDSSDISLPHSLKVFAGTEKTIEEPVYRTEEYTEEVPYVSFDENGDEVTKYRTVTKEKKVETGTQSTIKVIFDPFILDDIYGFGYENLKKVLSKWINQENLIQV